MSALRVLVAVHQLDLGGSQTNAVDLATAMHDLGHEIVVAGPDGPLAEVLRGRGVRHVPVALDRMGAAPSAYGELLRLTREVEPDLVHAYELIPSLLTFHGAHRRDRVPMLMTVNSMAVPDFLPDGVPLLVCNPVIAGRMRPRRAPTGILEIPTDCAGQYPGYPDGGFRAEVGVQEGELLVVAVSRFARNLKQQGLASAIRTAGRLARDHAFRLVLVGDGPAMPELRALADGVNERVGRTVVVLTGQRPDPRPAYAAADVVLGMGGSLLRAMAFGKPCVVQGEEGFWRALDAGSARAFRWHGFYGVGDGDGEAGDALLAHELSGLLADPGLRAVNGAFALALVRRFHSLERAADTQLTWYRRTVAEHRRAPLSEAVRSTGSLASWLVQRRLRRLRGTDEPDWFNSTRVIADGVRAPVPESFRPEPVRDEADRAAR